MTVDDDILRRAKERVGSVLRGKYRLDRLLGVGGMGAVFAATHQNNGNKVAVKMLHVEFSVNSEIRGRFLREGYIANSVEHDGIVRVIDDETAEDGAVFLVLELLEGETLADRQDKTGTLSALEVARIGSAILEVLAAAHEKGVVHRDIKPENVFLTKQGATKILDFGIARLHDGGKSSTRSGQSIGTPAYMAPEQALGHTTKIGPHTDVWSVGATMFTLLTAKLVHEAESPSEMLVRSATVHARPIESVGSQVPPVLAKIIDKALAFHIADRWPSALAMRDEIISVLDEIRASDLQGALSPTEPPPKNGASRAETPIVKIVGAPRVPVVITPPASGSPRPTSGEGPTLSASTASTRTSPEDPERPRRRGAQTMLAGGALLVVGVVVGIGILSRRGGETKRPPLSSAPSADTAPIPAVMTPPPHTAPLPQPATLTSASAAPAPSTIRAVVAAPRPRETASTSPAKPPPPTKPTSDPLDRQ